jgi:AcrR family transcriptional regulator
MATPRKTPRRAPQQARAKATIDVILEATAQILEKHGERAFNTNRIAERAGISIGSLYQYFPNKYAILREMAARETAALHEATRHMPVCDKDMLFVHRLIGAFEGRPRLRRIVVKALTADVSRIPAERLGEDTDTAANILAPEFGLSRVDGYVLSRAVIGVVRAAVIEDSPLLRTPEFAGAMVRLMRTFRRAARSRRSARVRPAKPRSVRGRA